jgi:18S rRNA (guanine1575-N7)-methyltransferase
MLEVAKINETKGDLLWADIGQGLGFRPATFDYAVSISVIQWLCHAEKSSHNPYRRLKTFFQSLYRCLVLGARCCFQFYPDNPEQIDIITNAALENGFTGGLVVDYPHSTKAKKYYLFLQAGFTKETLGEVMKSIPKADDDAREDEEEHVSYIKKRAELKGKRSSHKKPGYKSRDWIMKKKERQRRQGRDVRQDTKFTGRKRPGKGVY